MEIDLEKPIVPGWNLDLGRETPVWIEFRYEKLPNICLNCGKFDHGTRSCSVGLTEGLVQVYKAKFDAVIRADHTAVDRLMSRNGSPTKAAGFKEDEAVETVAEPAIVLERRVPSNYDLMSKSPELSEPMPVAPNMTVANPKSVTITDQTHDSGNTGLIGPSNSSKIHSKPMLTKPPKVRLPAIFKPGTPTASRGK